jgi:hypothetical protein
VFLICIYLVTNNAEHFFMNLLAISISASGEMSIQIFCWQHTFVQQQNKTENNRIEFHQSESNQEIETTLAI